MPDHRREQVMDAVVTKVTGLITTGTRVHRARVFPQEAAALPALLVYQGPDIPVDDDNEKYDFIDSDLEINIEVWVQASTGNVDETLNLINKEVVIALSADRTQGLNFVIDTNEDEVSEPEFSGDGNKRTGKMIMQFIVLYRRSRTDPSV